MSRVLTEFRSSARLGIATNILAKRLEDFVAAGLMQRRQALELKPVIIALTEWGDQWVRPGPVVFRSEAGDQPVELQLRRTGDDSRVAIADVFARRR